MGSICRKDKARCISSLDWIGKVSLQPSLCFAAQIVTYLLHNATSSTSDQLQSQMPSLLLQANFCRSFLQDEVTLDIPSSYTKKYFAFRALPSVPAWLWNRFYLRIIQLSAAGVTAINSCRFETDGKFDDCICSARPLSWWLFYFHFSLFFEVIPWPSFIKVKYLNCLRTNFELFYDLSKSPLRLEA